MWTRCSSGKGTEEQMRPGDILIALHTPVICRFLALDAVLVGVEGRTVKIAVLLFKLVKG